MKRGLSFISAILAGLTSCVKVETFNDEDSYNSIIEYAVNSKNNANHVLFGPIEICPFTWSDTDAECYVQIDNERVLILNKVEPYNTNTGKQNVKILSLHYKSKEDISKDFKKIIELSEFGYGAKVNLSASIGEISGAGFDTRFPILLENISVDYDTDSYGREYYFLVFNYRNSEGSIESSFIIIPAEFVA